ncbi:MAG: phosphatase PAP2 family protein [Acidobacteriota bacterium]
MRDLNVVSAASDVRKSDRSGIEASSLWIWGVPALLLIPVVILLINDTNIDVFLSLNRLSRMTGDRVWALLTVLADGLIVSVFFLPWIRRHPRRVGALMLAVVINTVLNHMVKQWLQIPRPPVVIQPEHFHLIGPSLSANAFPSGHASMIFILAGLFALTEKRMWTRLLFLACASCVALSRIVVGVHWPLDVLAGAAMGWLIAWAALSLSGPLKWIWTGWRLKVLGALLLLCCIALLFVDFTGYDVMTEQRIFALLIFFCGGMEYLKLYGIRLFGRKRPLSL